MRSIAKYWSWYERSLRDWHSPPEKCPNTEFFLIRFFPHSDWVRRNADSEKYGPEKIPYLDTFQALIALHTMQGGLIDNISKLKEIDRSIKTDRKKLKKVEDNLNISEEQRQLYREMARGFENWTTSKARKTVTKFKRSF